MRPALIWLALAAVTLAAAQHDDEPWVEEEDVEEPYNEYPDEETHDRRRREVYVENPYEEHVRVKRRCYDEPEYRVRRSAEYSARRPRQLHQYEVHEFTDDARPESPTYEEMLAASAEHYHRVYAAPRAQTAARYLSPEVSVGAPLPLVYRPVASDNNVPFASSNVPVRVPLQAIPINTKNIVPIPLAASSSVLSPVSPLAVASAPVPVKQVADGDSLGAAAGHHHGYSHGHDAGGGHHNHGHHHGERGGESTKGYKDNHYLDKGNKGHKTDELHRKEYEEAEGKKKKHHDRAGHEGSHEEEAFGQRGAHFDEKKGHKKGHKSKGYHNKYHKDEIHKEHKFYDDYHKGGEHHRYGKFKAKHATNESGKKKAVHLNAGHDYVERGKKGYSNKGHLDGDHKGYHGKHGHEEHHAHHEDHGSKGGKEGGKQWGYATKH